MVTLKKLSTSVWIFFYSWHFSIEKYIAGGKKAGAKIRSHIRGTWSWIQPVCNFTKILSISILNEMCHPVAIVPHNISRKLHNMLYLKVWNLSKIKCEFLMTLKTFLNEKWSWAEIICCHLSANYSTAITANNVS